MLHPEAKCLTSFASLHLLPTDNMENSKAQPENPVTILKLKAIIIGKRLPCQFESRKQIGKSSNWCVTQVIVPSSIRAIMECII